MATVAPLTPLTYDFSRFQSTFANVVAPPYDVISPEERAALAARDPHNVVKLILPEGEAGAQGADAKYAAASALFEQMKRDKVLVRDDAPGFYVYEQTFAPPGGGAKVTRRGFLGLVRVVPFSDRVVLPHERTLSGPKEDRLKLFRATCTNFSPGFMLYRDPLRTLDATLEAGKPLAQFTTSDAIEHRLSKVEDAAALARITAFMKDQALLIADGHHRYETSLRYAQEAAAAHPGMSDKARARYFMVFFANEDDPNLLVFPTHRHVHDVAGAPAFAAMREKLASMFHVEPLVAASAGGDAASIARAATAMLAEKAKAKKVSFAVFGPHAEEQIVVTLKDDANLATHRVLAESPEALRRTDVAVLHGAILEDVLGITKEAQAAKTNLWYPQDAAAALTKLRGGEGQALFVMNPTPVADVRAVAEAGSVMPQKSTFFYPKVITGLAIHTLEHDQDVAAS